MTRVQIKSNATDDYRLSACTCTADYSVRWQYLQLLSAPKNKEVIFSGKERGVYNENPDGYHNQTSVGCDNHT